jgi:tetratricopeptide (TPR) repeat protein
MKSVLTAVFLIAFLQSTAQSGLSAQQWQEDLKFLQQTIHHDYPYLFKKTKAEEFDAAVDNLHRSIPELENHEIITGIARIIALFKYGHTRTGLSEEPAVFRHFPFNLYHFSDGIYIQGIHEDYRDALGARLIAVAGMPVEEALQAVYPVVPAENSQFFKAYGIHYLRIPEVLHAQGITATLSETLTLTLEKAGKVFETTFNVLPKGESPPDSYGFVQQEGEWLDAREQGSTPLYRKKLERHYYFEYLPDTKTMYVRHSQVVHDKTEDIPTFFARVLDSVDTHDVERLVLDVRLNGGGNNYYNKPVIRGIIQSEKIDQIGKFYVILGRRTYSACQNLVLELDSYTNAIFVGEPTAENINFYGDNNRVALPNSGLPVYLSFAWWQDKPQWEDGPWLAPHIAADMSFEEYKTNHDPVLQAALNFDADNFVLDPMQYMTSLYMEGDMQKLGTETQRMIADPRYRYYDFEGELTDVGHRMLATGDVGQAVAVYSFVTQLFPDSASALVNLAAAHERAGQTEEAIEYYSKALELAPEGPVAKHSSEKLGSLKED